MRQTFEAEEARCITGLFLRTGLEQMNEAAKLSADGVLGILSAALQCVVSQVLIDGGIPLLRS